MWGGRDSGRRREREGQGKYLSGGEIEEWGIRITEPNLETTIMHTTGHVKTVRIRRKRRREALPSEQQGQPYPTLVSPRCARRDSSSTSSSPKKGESARRCCCWAQKLIYAHTCSFRSVLSRSTPYILHPVIALLHHHLQLPLPRQGRTEVFEGNGAGAWGWKGDQILLAPVEEAGSIVLLLMFFGTHRAPHCARALSCRKPVFGEGNKYEHGGAA